MFKFFEKIRRLIFKERIYFYLLISAIFFYFTVFAFDRFSPEKSHVPAPKPKAQTQAITQKNLTSADAWNERLAKHPELESKIQLFMLVSYALLISGIIFGSIGLNHLLHGEELVSQSKTHLKISWSIVDVVRLIIIFIWFGIILNLILLAFKVIFVKVAVPWFLLAHTMAVDAVALVFMCWIVVRTGSKLKDLFGFDWKRIPIKEVFYGFSTYVTVLPFLIGILLVLVYITGLFSYEPPAHPLVNIFEEGIQHPFLIGFSVFLACFVAPVIEEIFFRGFLYPAVKKAWGKFWAPVLSAGLFAGVHESLFSFLPIFFLGLVLCYLYEKRRSVLPCISLHIIHNSLFISYFFLIKNLMA